MPLTPITRATFVDDALNSPPPVLGEFTADRCPPAAQLTKEFQPHPAARG